MTTTSDTGDSVAGRYALEIEGEHACWLSTFEGGHATSDVVVEKVGAQAPVNKHLGGVVMYEPISFTFGADMSSKLFDWIRGTLAHDWKRKSGAIVAHDYNGQEMSRLEFTNALVTEIDLPDLDASSQRSAQLTVRCAVESTRLMQGARGSGPHPTAATKQRRWLASNFRLTIDGLDCRSVSKVESMAIKLVTSEGSSGEQRTSTVVPSHVETPDLVVTLPQSGSGDFMQWHQDFVIKGNNSSSKEKSGKLEYLDPSLQSTLFAVGFHNLGIYKWTPGKIGASSEVPHVTVKMYCHEMELIPEFVESAPVGGTPSHPSGVDQQALKSTASTRLPARQQSFTGVRQPTRYDAN